MCVVCGVCAISARDLNSAGVSGADLVVIVPSESECIGPKSNQLLNGDGRRNG